MRSGVEVAELIDEGDHWHLAWKGGSQAPNIGRGERAFGHPGAGGCLGFADPDYQLGFGYVTSRMGQSLRIDERATTLIDSIYRLLETKES